MALLRSEAIGRLTEDPKFRVVNIGGNEVPVVEFSLAVNYGFGDNQKTEYVNCVAWRKLAEVVRDYCTKGRKVYVAGKQQTRKYTQTKDNVEFNQYKTEWILDDLEFCDNAGNERGGNASSGGGERRSSSGNSYDNGGHYTPPAESDDAPF